MKAQMQIISIILIIATIVVLTGATYFWGKPLIDKRVLITQVATLKEFVKRLDEKIVEMARTCTGFCDESLTVPPGPYVKVYSYSDTNPDNNSILVEFALNYLMMGDESVPLNTNVLEEVAPYGETNGVLTMRQTLKGQQYVIIFKLHYRELDTTGLPKEGYKIILEPDVIAGNNKIIISYAGSSLVQGGAANGGPLTETKIKIQTT